MQVQSRVHRRKFNALALGAVLALPAARANGLDALSPGDWSQALKMALEKGAIAAVSRLGVQDGFWGNPSLRIGLPDPLAKASRAARMLGLGGQLDELTLQMNRAAEAVVPLSARLLSDAVKTLTVQDARGLLQGGDMAVTRFFADRTRQPLTLEFEPTVTRMLQHLGVVERYNAVAGRLAASGLVRNEQVSLQGHVTSKTLDGLYTLIGEEEKKIRSHPAQAGSDLLGKVFGSLR